MSVNHLVSAEDITKPVLAELVRKMHGLAQFPVPGCLPQVMNPRRIVLLFYGPETRRTFDAFNFAVQDLGWQTGGGMRAESFSGMVTGDSFRSAIRFYSRWSDAIVLRHHDAEVPRNAASYSSVPILSAGGSREGEHPTQALGDYALLERVLGGIGGKEVAFVGNLRDSSSVHSLCYLLRHDMPYTVYVVAPEEQGLQDKYAHVLKRVVQIESVAKLPKTTNAVYLVQSPDAKEPDRFGLTKEKLSEFSNVRVLHPLPEGPELPGELFQDARVVTDEQMNYVQFGRMVCLEYFVGRK